MKRDDHKVGYKKPPRETRFKPGRSGNPAGRPKGAKNLAADLKEELEEKIVVSEGGTPLEITKQRAMIKTMFAKALKGDSRAAQVLINLKLGLDQIEGAKSDDMLSDDDKAVVDEFEARIRGREKPEEDGS